ncbi:uncharacterized protein M421DRAFT_265509 [Didymella exigua CBS 183.55]|uniref:Uncharacterized protein n=1 Tax=Didymella exigua CBS 183.55 TaxID=1150837 RepID=A0A6A5RHP5_9PLEO|nr:uncharacterized protein M421DRAFT_265509 [Didymella exigua CBS 183.55]KAF1925127.1 hypothetical protein M421DRAFT_265509 [Didymella exigua CBS 183.55]
MSTILLHNIPGYPLYGSSRRCTRGLRPRFRLQETTANLRRHAFGDLWLRSTTIGRLAVTKDNVGLAGTEDHPLWLPSNLAEAATFLRLPSCQALSLQVLQGDRSFTICRLLKYIDCQSLTNHHFEDGFAYQKTGGRYVYYHRASDICPYWNFRGVLHHATSHEGHCLP